jgi:hypothetical protein
MEAIVIRDTPIFHFSDIALNFGKKRIINKIKGKITIYLSCVYKVRLANNMLKSNPLFCAATVILSLVDILIVKNKNNKKNVAANPSSIPPLNSWVTL